MRFIQHSFKDSGHAPGIAAKDDMAVANQELRGFPLVFVCRIAPRTHRRNMPRGTLIDSSVDIQSIDDDQNYEEFYHQTVGRGHLPNPLVLQFGQPPTKNGQLEIRRGDVLVLLVGSDDPNGSLNPRGVIGIALVENAYVRGSGPSARCALSAIPILRLDDYLSNQTILRSPYRKMSRIDDIPIFGLQGAPQAHNCVRFFQKEEDADTRRQRLQGLLGMFTEVDSHVPEKLNAYPWLAALVPSSPPDTRSMSTQDLQHYVSLRLTVALCTKPLAILIGPSGTGKSKIAIDLAASLDYGDSLPTRLTKSRVMPATCLAFVPVAADWIDERNILGYKNPFGPKRVSDEAETHQTYEITDALKLMLRAMHPSYRNKPHFLVLDEMNLSHVERYFSPFLSLMEADRSVRSSGRFDLVSRDDLRLIHDVLRDQGTSPMEVEAAAALIQEGSGLPFPQNLFVIGTVNVDETTYMFSPKVLDRAFVLELRSVKPSAYLEGSLSPEETIETTSAAQLFDTSIEARTQWKWDRQDTVDRVVRQVATEIGEDAADEMLTAVKSALDGIYTLLQPVGFDFAYRAINEVIQYMAVWMQARLLQGHESSDIAEDWPSALDSAVLMKILPKIHGNRRQLGDSLNAVAAFLSQESTPKASYTWGDSSIGIGESERLGFSLPLSAEKAENLHRVLQASGYVTFIS